MNPMKLIEFHAETFTNNDRIISDFIKKNPEVIIKYSIVEIADRIEVSKSALLRFCQKLGYNGFSEFKYAMSHYLYAGNVNEETSNNSIITSLIQTLQKIDNDEYFKSLEGLSTQIIKSKVIRIFGLHETGLAARQLQYRLLSLGIDSRYIVESEIMSDFCELSNTEDLNIFFSLSATSSSIVDSLEKSIARKATTALITQNSQSEHIEKVDYYINIPDIDIINEFSFIGSQMLNFILIELLINSISKQLIQHDENL